MSTAFPPIINVAHVAGPDGRCARCKAGLGAFIQVADSDNKLPDVNRPWKVGERVIEYECADSRTRFALDVMGFAQDCIP